MIVLKTDGSCMPNPGEMGIGIAIYREGKLIKAISKYIGYGTNNIAEYSAFIKGLEEIKKIKRAEDHIRIFIDSLLIYKQIRGEYKIKKQELKPLCLKGRELIQEIGNIELMWNNRTGNEVTDRLAKEAIWLKRINEMKRGK